MAVRGCGLVPGTGWHLALPGPHYDEVVEVLPILRILHGLPAETFRNAGVALAGNTWPLMTQDYIGALNTYLTVPYFLVLGVNVIALRLMPITLGVLTLLLTWTLAAAWCENSPGLARNEDSAVTGEVGSPIWVPAIATLLLATSPSFVFWTRQGIFVTSVTQVLALLYVLFLLRWWRKGRLRDLLWAAWWAGIGLYAKFLFLWVLVAGAAILVAGVLWSVLRRRGGDLPLFRHTPWWGYPTALAVFLLALSPLIQFNWQTGGTVRAFTRNMTRSYYGVDNTRWAENLAQRWDQLRAVTEGGQFWYLGGVFHQPWTWYALWAAGGIAVAVALWRRRVPMPVLLPYAFVLLVLVQSTVTVSALWPTHFAILVPFLSLTLAVSLATLARTHARAHLAIALTVALLTVAQARVTVQYHQALARSGGLADHSDAIYRLADAAQARGWTAPVALDWGLDAPLPFLTDLQVNPIEVFGYERLDAPDPGFADRVASFISNPDTVFLAHDPGHTVFKGRVEALRALAEARGQCVETVARFQQRDGTPLFLALQVRQPGPSTCQTP